MPPAGYTRGVVVLGGELAVPSTRNPLNAGLNSLPRVQFQQPGIHPDRPPRNRRSRTSSGPEGSSDKRCGLCRGSIPVTWMMPDWRTGFDGGCTTDLFRLQRDRSFSTPLPPHSAAARCPKKDSRRFLWSESSRPPGWASAGGALRSDAGQPEAPFVRPRQKILFGLTWLWTVLLSGRPIFGHHVRKTGGISG